MHESRACLPHLLPLPPGPSTWPRPPTSPAPTSHPPLAAPPGHPRFSRVSQLSPPHGPAQSPEPRPHLLHVLLGPQVRGVHERAHDLDVAVHHQRLVRPVRVDAHTAMVEDRVGHLRPLPQHVAVTLKLARVGSLAQVGGKGLDQSQGTGDLQCPGQRGNPAATPPAPGRDPHPTMPNFNCPSHCGPFQSLVGSQKATQVLSTSTPVKETLAQRVGTCPKPPS